VNVPAPEDEVLFAGCAEMVTADAASDAIVSSA